MDPNQTLRELLHIARKVLSRPGTDDDADDLAARVVDLDEWLVKGGFFPARWLEKRTAPTTRTCRMCGEPALNVLSPYCSKECHIAAQLHGDE